MRRMILSMALAGVLLVGVVGTAGAQVPVANASERAPCTAQLASSFGPATGGIGDEVHEVQAIAAALGVAQGEIIRVAATTSGTVEECVALLNSLVP